jgi:aminoglycoside/choline kinase family phosphotransferase
MSNFPSMADDGTSSVRPITRCRLLLPNDEGRVAAVIRGQGPALPECHLSVDWSTPLEVTRKALSAAAGCRVNLLRRLFHRPSAPETGGMSVWLAERYDLEEKIGPELEWAPLAEVIDSTLDPAEARSAIETWAREVASGDEPPFRQAWTRPGWHAGAEDWIELQLERAGIQPTAIPEQMRSWAISNLMRVATDQGQVYFKAVPPYFACETAATVGLSGLYPGLVPEVIASDTERGWLLLRGFDGVRLEDVDTREKYAEAFRLLVRMQVDFINRADAIADWGGLVRPVRQLPPDAHVFADEALPQISSHVPDWPADTQSRLRASLPRLRELSNQLRDTGVPETLIHGDWHTNNVHYTDRGPMFLDWSDAAFTHPFFDLFTMFDFHGLDEMPDDRAVLLDAYLSAWRQHTPEARLEEAARLAWILAPLYHALSYARIFANVEEADRPMFARDVLRFVLLYLQRIEQPEAGTHGWDAAS